MIYPLMRCRHLPFQTQPTAAVHASTTTRVGKGF